jgi:hypothetical protein
VMLERHGEDCMCCHPCPFHICIELWILQSVLVTIVSDNIQESTAETESFLASLEGAIKLLQTVWLKQQRFLPSQFRRPESKTKVSIGLHSLQPL